MLETTLHAYGRATQREPAADFTATIFARIALDRYAAAPSPLGDAFVAWNATGVTALRLGTEPAAFEDWYAGRIGRRVVPALESDPILTAAREALAGGAAAVPFDLQACSPFEQRVLAKAAEIARGHARPYAWLAREIGMPGAARAVGNALGRNPVPLLIPCHRVVRSDGSPGGYVFGDGAKRALLEREGVDFPALERLAAGGYHYVGNEADGDFCLPTCGDIAIHAGEPGYRPLRTVADARALGLVPCNLCRPIAA